jgi:hypothetical protein
MSRRLLLCGCRSMPAGSARRRQHKSPRTRLRTPTHTSTRCNCAEPRTPRSSTNSDSDLGDANGSGTRSRRDSRSRAGFSVMARRSQPNQALHLTRAAFGRCSRDGDPRSLHPFLGGQVCSASVAATRAACQCIRGRHRFRCRSVESVGPPDRPDRATAVFQWRVPPVAACQRGRLVVYFINWKNASCDFPQDAGRHPS